MNPGVVTTANYILWYAKNSKYWSPNRVFSARSRDPRYGQFIKNKDADISEWEIISLNEAYASYLGITSKELKGRMGPSYEKKIEKFVINNRDRVIQLARVLPKDVNKEAKKALEKSIVKECFVVSARDGMEPYVFNNGKQVLFYSIKVRKIDGELRTGEALSNIWDNLLSNNVHKEGGVRFPKGKKPEGLIKRVIELATNENDIVLDSFSGSGTTVAVAHKLGRKWIAIELGEQCDTHISPRLRSVVDGSDQDGISKAVDWKGGGGFRYYNLAPSLLEKDKWGNWVVNKNYNPAMLAEAICKLEGFSYAPSDADWWNHGYSTEQDFIYVTTQNLSVEQLEALSDEVGSERSLLVCCAAFRGQTERFTNLTLKKIPKMVLSRCEWAHDDYSLNVENLPQMVRDPEQADLLGDKA